MSDVMTEPEKNEDKEKKLKEDVKTLAVQIRREMIKERERKRIAKNKSRRATHIRKKMLAIEHGNEPLFCNATVSESSYKFSSQDTFEMYLRSQTFRDIINSGCYAYVDGRWVLKSPECIKIENGVLQTCILPKNLDDYCLVKSVQTVLLVPAGTTIRPGKCRVEDLQRKIYSFKNAERIDSITKINNNNLYLFFGGGQEPPNNFNGAVVYYMDNRGMTVEALAGETGLSEKTIQRMRTSEENQPTLESIVAFSVGLSLSTYQSGRLLHLAGYSLTPKPIHQAYSLCLDMASSSTVEECNYFLIQLGYKPLTELYDKEKAKKLPRLLNLSPVKITKPNKPRER